MVNIINELWSVSPYTWVTKRFCWNLWSERFLLFELWYGWVNKTYQQERKISFSFFFYSNFIFIRIIINWSAKLYIMLFAHKENWVLLLIVHISLLTCVRYMCFPVINIRCGVMMLYIYLGIIKYQRDFACIQ